MSNTIIFNSTKDFYIKNAGNFESRYENTHYTWFKNDKLEKIGEDSGLEFHYELHFCKKEKFIRLCCHIRDYDNHKNYRGSADMRQQLALEGKEHLIDVRNDLKLAFKKEFENDDCDFIAKRFNYVGLIRRNINSTDYSDAIAESEKFIADTYDRALRTIFSTLTSR